MEDMPSKKMPFTIHRVTRKTVDDMPLETPRYGANADFHSKKNALQYTEKERNDSEVCPL